MPRVRQEHAFLAPLIDDPPTHVSQNRDHFGPASVVRLDMRQDNAAWAARQFCIARRHSCSARARRLRVDEVAQDLPINACKHVRIQKRAMDWITVRTTLANPRILPSPLLLK